MQLARQYTLRLLSQAVTKPTCLAQNLLGALWYTSTRERHQRRTDCEKPKPCPPKDFCCTKPPSPWRQKPCKKPPPFVSMWEKPPEKEKIFEWGFPKKCCPECDNPIRFDELYYKPSDKCRRYQRTWWDCCPRYVPKRVCLWCDAVPPEVEHRCIEPFEKKCSNVPCPNDPCPRVRMPCCRLARIPPDCRRNRVPACCEKIKCPFPSYSECCKRELANIPQRPKECRCLQPMPPEICTANRYEKYANEHHIPIWPCRRTEPKSL